VALVVPTSTRSTRVSNSLFGSNSEFPRARESRRDLSVTKTALLFACCGPWAMLACRAKTVGGLQIDKTKLSQSTKVGIVITLGALLSAAVDDDDCPITSNAA